jgi:SAM-dependent methyltransferase
LADYVGMFELHDAQRDRRRANGVLMVDILWNYIRPKSVIDLGCGLGFFLKAVADRGASVVAIDGDWVAPLETEIDKSLYRIADLNEPFQCAERFDLAATLEVAEHLKPERSKDFVAELCALSDRVLFSAGIPGQGGVGHTNLRWQDEWAKMFAGHGYRCYDPIRRKIAGHDEAFPWFTQNTLLFIKEGVPTGRLLDEHLIAPEAASYVSKLHYTRRMKTMHKRLDELRGTGEGGPKKKKREKTHV